MALGRIGQSQRRRLIPRRQPLTTASATGRIPHILKQPLITRPQGRGPTQGVVGVNLRHRPALPPGQLPAQPHLVLAARCTSEL